MGSNSTLVPNDRRTPGRERWNGAAGGQPGPVARGNLVESFRVAAVPLDNALQAGDVGVKPPPEVRANLAPEQHALAAIDEIV
jgi:hypothetical protein